jgi:hypothetical protein
VELKILLTFELEIIIPLTMESLMVISPHLFRALAPYTIYYPIHRFYVNCKGYCINYKTPLASGVLPADGMRQTIARFIAYYMQKTTRKENSSKTRLLSIAANDPLVEVITGTEQLGTDLALALALWGGKKFSDGLTLPVPRISSLGNIEM